MAIRFQELPAWEGCNSSTIRVVLLLRIQGRLPVASMGHRLTSLLCTVDTHLLTSTECMVECLLPCTVAAKTNGVWQFRLLVAFQAKTVAHLANSHPRQVVSWAVLTFLGALVQAPSNLAVLALACHQLVRAVFLAPTEAHLLTIVVRHHMVMQEE